MDANQPNNIGREYTPENIDRLIVGEGRVVEYKGAEYIVKTKKHYHISNIQ